MGRPRDSKRSAVYAAENEAFGQRPKGDLATSCYPHPKAVDRFETLPEVRAYIVRVMSSKRFEKIIGRRIWFDPKAAVRVKDGRGRKSACCWSYRRFSFPMFSRTRWIILHEIAHGATGLKHREPVAAHGREFCAVYLELVRYWIGKEAHDALREQFKQHKVPYAPKRKGRKLSPEEREVLVERLAAARAAKVAA